MVCKCVQLVLLVVQAKQNFATRFGNLFPPQTTSFPPDRKERLWPLCPSLPDPCLPRGRSGMEQVLVGGDGKISTEESLSSSLNPPTTTCPDAKMFKDEARKLTNTVTSK